MHFHCATVVILKFILSISGRRSRRNSISDDSQLTIENFGGSQDQLNMIGRAFEREKSFTNTVIGKNLKSHHWRQSANDINNKNNNFCFDPQSPLLLFDPLWPMHVVQLCSIMIMMYRVLKNKTMKLKSNHQRPYVAKVIPLNHQMLLVLIVSIKMELMVILKCSSIQVPLALHPMMILVNQYERLRLQHFQIQPRGNSNLSITKKLTFHVSIQCQIESFNQLIN